MGACYTKKASQLGDAYTHSYPARQNSPVRIRKKTMNRPAPYPRAAAPAHSFGFRRRGIPVTSQRVQPTDSAPSGRRANHGSRESVASNSSGSDSNGNIQRSMAIPARRQLPRPQVAHVKPRTAGGAARRTNRANSLKINDSGLGTTRGSFASSASSDRDENAALVQSEIAPIATGEEFNDVGEGVAEEKGGSDFQVGIQTEGATIALSVNIHKGATAIAGRPQVTVSDPAVKARVTQIQRPRFGFTQPAGLSRPPGPSHITPTPTNPSASSGSNKVVTTTRLSSGITRPSRPTVVPKTAARVTPGASVAENAPPPPPSSAASKRPVALSGTRSGASVLDQTVKSLVTRWEEKVVQLSHDAVLNTPSRTQSQERSGSGGMSVTVPGRVLLPLSVAKPTFKGYAPRVASPVTPGANVPRLLNSALSPPIALSTPASATFHVSPRPSAVKKSPKPSEAVNSIVQLRREMRQLTRDVATSPLHKPRVRDTGTCTEHSPPRSHGPHGESGELSPLLSGMQSSRSGIEDFIDDEIGDQPAFGAAYRPDMTSVSMHSDGFIDDVISGVGFSLADDPLPPLEITESAKPCDVSDYVRPYRLTPRPMASLTTLETPLRIQVADFGSSASARRQQMEERAERLARRLQLKTPGSSAVTDTDSDSGLGSTYQRLGLRNAAITDDTDAAPMATEEDLSECHDLSSAEPSLSHDDASTTPDLNKAPVTAKPRDARAAERMASRDSGRAESPESRDCAEAVLDKSRDEQLTLSEYTREALKESQDSFTEIPRGHVLHVSKDQPLREDKSIAKVYIRRDSTESPDSGSDILRESASHVCPRVKLSRQESHESCDSAWEEYVETRDSWERQSAGARREDAASDVESQDEAFAASSGGCRPRTATYRRVSELRDDVTSPTTSLGSDDLMADFDKDSDTLCEDDDSVGGQVSRIQRMRIRSTDGGRPSPDPGSAVQTKLLKPPRQSSQGDVGDWLLIDRDTYMYMAQDFTHTKTMLHKLRRILQDAETANPFEHSFQSGKSRGASVSSDCQLSSIDGRPVSIDGATTDLAAENVELKRQVASLQSQLEERDRTILLLQQQMSKYTTTPLDVSSVATQASQSSTDDPQVITVCAGK